MRVRRRGQLVRLRLDPLEARLLSRLFEDLLELVRPDAADAGDGADIAGDPVLRRLFPAGYRDDDAAATEFRSLTELSLRTERCQRAEECVAELAGNPGELDLSDEAAQRWLRVLNDARLALGTRLDISEEDEPGQDRDDPLAEQRAIYYWLTAVQDSIVGAMMR